MSNIFSVSLKNGMVRGDVEPLETTFKDLDLAEKDLEELIRKNIDILIEDEDLLIVGQQVQNTQNGRSDLTAIDKDGNIILIEIKRDLSDQKLRKEPFEFQAIRYAASNAKIKNIDDLVDKIFAPYISKYKEEFKEVNEGTLTPQEMGTRAINEFLKCNNNSFNSKQRIVLAASEFDPQTISAVAWLIENGIDITCISLLPVKINDDIFLQVDKQLPLKKTDDFYIDIKGSNISSSTSKSKKYDKKSLPKIPKLFEEGLIKAGDKFYLKSCDPQNSSSTVKNGNYVEFNGEELRFNEWGKKVKGWSSICIYEWAVRESDGKTLDDIRQDYIKINQ